MLLNQKGYSTLKSFCDSVGIDDSNMNKRLTGVRQKIEISFMFKLANHLHVPVEEIIEIFYPDEWEENKSLIEENHERNSKNMTYYVVDNNGDVYGEYSSKNKAEILLEEHANNLRNEGKTDAEIKALGLEVIEGNY